MGASFVYVGFSEGKMGAKTVKVPYLWDPVVTNCSQVAPTAPPPFPIPPQGGAVCLELQNARP